MRLRPANSPSRGTESPRLTASKIWNSVACSADGTKLVASVERFGTTNYLYTSADSGYSWVTRTVAGDLSWTSWAKVASSIDGTTLLAGKTDGSLYRSVNSGESWAQITPGIGYLSHMAVSDDGGKVIVSNLASDYLRTFTPQMNTLVGRPGFPFAAAELVYAGNGQFIVVSQNGTLSFE